MDGGGSSEGCHAAVADRNVSRAARICSSIILSCKNKLYPIFFSDCISISNGGVYIYEIIIVLVGSWQWENRKVLCLYCKNMIFIDGIVT